MTSEKAVNYFVLLFTTARLKNFQTCDPIKLRPIKCIITIIIVIVIMALQSILWPWLLFQVLDSIHIR
jgi:hypothetical protein